MDPRDELRDAIAGAGNSEGAQRVEFARRAARAAGELALSGALRESDVDDRALRHIRVDLPTLDLSDLSEGARALRALAPGFRRTAPLVEHLRGLLARRTEVEKIRRGASALLGHTFPWSAEQERHVRAFDDAAEEVLYRLVSVNDVRAALLEDIAPPFRGTLFWLSRGVELPSDTVDRMADVAALVALFAPARAAFDDLLRARDGRAQGSTRRIARGVNLEGILTERGSLVLNEETFEIRATAPDLLVVRVRGALRDTERPRLRTASAELPMEPVAGTRTQFELTVEPRVRLTSSLSVVIPFAYGDRVVDLLRE